MFYNHYHFCAFQHWTVKQIFFFLCTPQLNCWDGVQGRGGKGLGLGGWAHHCTGEILCIWVMTVFHSSQICAVFHDDKVHKYMRKYTKERQKYMTNGADSEEILIDQQYIEKVTEFKYLGQSTHLKDTTKEEIYARIRAAGSGFRKKQGNTPR